MRIQKKFLRFHRQLDKLLEEGRDEFCEEIRKDHNFGYLLILLGFPLLIVGPLGKGKLLNAFIYVLILHIPYILIKSVWGLQVS